MAFAFASAVCWGLYIVFGKRLADLPSGPAAASGMLVAAFTICPLGIAESGARLFQPSAVLAGVALAVASSAVPYSLEMYALKRLPKNTFGILLSMEPAVGALSGYFVLHETLSTIQWIAITCIMSASVGTALGTRTKEPDGIPPDVL